MRKHPSCFINTAGRRVWGAGTEYIRLLRQQPPPKVLPMNGGYGGQGSTELKENETVRGRDDEVWRNEK